MSKSEIYRGRNRVQPGLAAKMTASAIEAEKAIEEKKNRKPSNGELIPTIEYALKKYETSHAKKNGTTEFEFVRIAVDYCKYLKVSDEDLRFYIEVVKGKMAKENEPR